MLKYSAKSKKLINSPSVVALCYPWCGRHRQNRIGKANCKQCSLINAVSFRNIEIQHADYRQALSDCCRKERITIGLYVLFHVKFTHAYGEACKCIEKLITGFILQHATRVDELQRDEYRLNVTPLLQHLENSNQTTITVLRRLARLHNGPSEACKK